MIRRSDTFTKQEKLIIMQGLKEADQVSVKE